MVPHPSSPLPSPLLLSLSSLPRLCLMEGKWKQWPCQSAGQQRLCQPDGKPGRQRQGEKDCDVPNTVQTVLFKGVSTGGGGGGRWEWGRLIVHDHLYNPSSQASGNREEALWGVSNAADGKLVSFTLSLLCAWAFHRTETRLTGNGWIYTSCSLLLCNYMQL